MWHKKYDYNRMAALHAFTVASQKLSQLGCSTNDDSLPST
jgi:hypothetical protein